MGVLVWAVSGVVAFAVARIVPLARRRGWLAELAIAVIAALLLGIAATALDFGGWSEPDWRAGVFAFLGALAALGLLRAT
jgi:uncharacterized membrane protein YeaQ/YmgE (transglycosylase-associated protein family)